LRAALVQQWRRATAADSSDGRALDGKKKKHGRTHNHERRERSRALENARRVPQRHARDMTRLRSKISVSEPAALRESTDGEASKDASEKFVAVAK